MYSKIERAMEIEQLTPAFLRENPTTPFVAILAYIQANFSYTPQSFQNGTKLNLASENQGSAKVLFFAKQANWSAEDTLLLFAEHYQDVVQNPTGTSHENIRQFIQNGWEGVKFDGNVLS